MSGARSALLLLCTLSCTVPDPAYAGPAAGQQTTATSDDEASASEGNSASAAGDVTSATSDGNSDAGDTASGDGDTASGDGDTASGDGDTASGDGDTASGDGDTDSGAGSGTNSADEGASTDGGETNSEGGDGDGGDCNINNATDLTGDPTVTITDVSEWVIGHSACIVVDAGTIVRWNAQNFSAHPLTGGDGSPDPNSPITAAGPGSGPTPIDVEFTEPGVYPYYCIVHASMMAGVVIVI